MATIEQNKVWNSLSENKQNSLQNEYLKLLDIVTDDSISETNYEKIKARARQTTLVDIFGKENLKGKLNYEYIKEEIEHKVANNIKHRLDCIEKLLITAKYFNKYEDGKEWIPDFDNKNQIKWFMYYNHQEDKICYGQSWQSESSIVYFRSPIVIRKVIQVLGKETILDAILNEI